MTIIITDDDVKRVLPIGECIDAMRIAFKDFSEGSAVNLPRSRYAATHPDPKRRYFCNVHVGAVPSVGMACVRAGSQILIPPTPENNRRHFENPRPFNWGFVILFSIETAEPLALMHEYHLSGMRVGATSGLAVDVVTDADISTLGLFGSGKQATSALEAICAVRPITRVNVFSPNVDHCTDFAKRMTREGVAVIAAAHPQDVVEGADVICCATSAMEPVFDGEWLTDGQMVISIANSDATNAKRSEVDETTYGRATSVIVNDWESVIDNDQTEILEPLEAGLITRDQVVELGDVVAGKVEVKTSNDGVVYFKNNSGLAIQFAAAGGVIYDKVMAEGTNRVIPTEWLGTDLSALYDAGFRPSP